MIKNEQIKNALLEEIIEDEKEACFDRSYYSDEYWFKEFGNITREEAFKKSTNEFKEMSLEELLEYFGDRYDYVLENF